MTTGRRDRYNLRWRVPRLSRAEEGIPMSARTFAMKLVSVGYALILGVFIYFFVAFILPAAGTDPEAAAFVPIFVAFIAIFTVVGGASLLWAGARQRAWFWLVAAIPGLLVLLMFAPQISFSLTHPADANGFIPSLVAVAAAILVIVAGITVFREIRRGGAMWVPVGRPALVVTAVSSLIVGAMITSLLAAAAGASGGGVTEAPTVTDVVTAADTKFVETSLQMKNGEVLGLFVINRDGFAHSFDIDALDVHVQLPADSTTAVAIKPTANGQLEFYCAVPGHRDAGMVGTIAVD